MVEGVVTENGLSADIKLAGSDGFVLDVSVGIAPGSTLVVLGPNGAGKSTLVAALVGLSPIDEGRIELAGVVLEDTEAGISLPPSRRGIGVMFQDGLLFPHLSVRDNIAFGLKSTGVSKEEVAQRTDHWMDRFDLVGLAERRPPELSGGEAQRVALARAVATKPKLLILDEPLGSLDVTMKAHARRTIAEFLDSYDGPALVITHDPTEAFLLGDELCILEDGLISQSGTAQEIRLHPRSRYAADLAGTNLFEGTASDGVIDIGGHNLYMPAHDVSGEVIVTFHPRAVAIHRSQPEGSPRNMWKTAIAHVESLGDTARIATSAPLPVTAEVTMESTRSLDLDPGVEVWLSVKATELHVQLVAG
ncbi:MAG: ABC transporter ATP-binding protein [Armatimonadetes bacterium]|nr:MAG: ABC transporter ATP-binding protein [Armatimonadota bacterium]